MKAEAHQELQRKKKLKLSIVLPTYNEQDNIIWVVTKIRNQLMDLCSFEIIIVDDGSTDHTAYLIEEYVKLDPCARMISHQSNKGYGAAVSTGLKAALGEYVFFFRFRWSI